jgi:hypothetical protein
LSWRWVENPLRNNRQFWSNRRIGWSYATTCVLAGLGLVAAIKSGGMPWRLPQYVQRAELASADVNPRRAECFLERDDAKAAHAPTFCRSGRAGPATAILWGDSFADALQPAFDAASTQSNASLERLRPFRLRARSTSFPTPMRRIGQDSNPVPLATRQRYSSISRPRQRSIRS